MLTIEDAKEYFLVPFKDQKSLYRIGGKKRLQALEIVMDAKDVIATAGVNLETCYIMVNKDGKACEQLLEEMNDVLRKSKDADNKINSKANKELL